MGANFLMMWSYLKLLFGFDIFKIVGATGKPSGILFSLSLMGLVLVLNYRYLFHDNNYMSIIEEYSTESNSMPAKGLRAIVRRMYMALLLILITFLNLYVIGELLQ